MAGAIVVEQTGGPEVLQLRPHDPGPPGPGTARVRITAAGVNYIDVYHRTGLYPRPLPFVPGLEGAGVVEAVGDAAAGCAPGDRVSWASVPGSYACHVVAPTAQLVRVPPGVPDELAAAVMLQGMTAHYLAHGTRATRPGDIALVHAAAGGVGLLLVQLLKAAGARVVATCSTAEKEARVRAAGAAHVVRYTEQDFVAAVEQLTGGRGVDVVYDGVGQSTFEGSLRCLRRRGLLVTFGQSSGPVPPFNMVRLSELGSLFVTRPTLVDYIRERAELEQRASAVLDAVATGRLHVHIDTRYPLGAATAAHRALEGRATVGKILLIPALQ